MGLDIALAGGLHAGGVTQIWGPESVGKTYLVWKTAGMTQEIYGDKAIVVVLCIETLPDKGFARRAGCCIAYEESEIAHFNKMRVKNGGSRFTKEEIADLKMQIGKIYTVTSKTSDEGLDEIVRVLEGGFAQLCIIDSLGAMLTPAQSDNDVGDRVYGGSSILLTNFINKIMPLFIMERADGSMLDTTVIGINQARAVIGAKDKQKKTRAAAGAYALKHGMLASIELTKGAPIYPTEESEKSWGREVRWQLTKGKAGTHDGKKGEFKYFHVPPENPVFWSDVVENWKQWGVDTITDLVSTAKELGVFTIGGSWLTWKDDEGNVILKQNSADNFAEDIVNNPDLIGRLREDCLRAAKLPVVYR